MSDDARFNERVNLRLRDEQVIWLTTVGKDGTPQPSPVWFLWDGDTVLIYSRPDTPKLRNIARNPAVALSFNTDEHGNDVVILTGTAQADPQAPSANQVAAYLEKYTGGIASINMTPESFAATYSAALRVTIGRRRGW